MGDGDSGVAGTECIMFKNGKRGIKINLKG
jgi:hypothetical protein